MLCTEAITFADLPLVIAQRSIPAMDVQTTRLENLHRILEERYGGTIAKLAAAIGKDANQTRFILYPDRSGGRRIGEKLARQIELKLGLNPLSLDAEKDQNHELTPAQYAVREAVAKYAASIPDDVALSIATLIKSAATPRD